MFVFFHHSIDVSQMFANCWNIQTLNTGQSRLEQHSNKYKLLSLRSEGCTNKQDEGRSKCSGLQVRHVWATTLRSIKGHTHSHMQMWVYVLYLQTAYMYTHAHTPNTCPLRLQGPPYNLQVHPRVPVAALVLLTALAEPAGDNNTSSSLPSCA